MPRSSTRDRSSSYGEPPRTTTGVGRGCQPWPSGGPAALARLEHRVDSVGATTANGNVEVVVATRVAPPVLAWCARCTYRYVFDAAGRLSIVVEGAPEGMAPRLFRPGRAGYGACTSFPRGLLVRPGASRNLSGLRSRRGASAVTTLALEQMETPYVVPQENGHRSQIRWCQLSDCHQGLLVTGTPLFGFSIHRWSTSPPWPLPVIATSWWLNLALGSTSTIASKAWDRPPAAWSLPRSLTC